MLSNMFTYLLNVILNVSMVSEDIKPHRKYPHSKYHSATNMLQVNLFQLIIGTEQSNIAESQGVQSSFVEIVTKQPNEAHRGKCVHSLWPTRVLALVPL